MKLDSTRVRILVTTVTVAALTTVGVAIAAKPKAGSYHWGDQPAGTPYEVAQVNFKVSGKPAKVKEFGFLSFVCGGAGATLNKALQINRKGKFGFKGKGLSPNGSKVPMSVTGRFVTKTKAKGTVKSPDCFGSKIDIDFVATRGSG